MLRFLFLLVLDLIMKKTTNGVNENSKKMEFYNIIGRFGLCRRYSTFILQFQDLNDCKVSSKGYKLTPKICKTLRMEIARNEEHIVINNESVEDVKGFIYQGAFIEEEKRKIERTDAENKGSIS